MYDKTLSPSPSLLPHSASPSPLAAPLPHYHNSSVEEVESVLGIAPQSETQKFYNHFHGEYGSEKVIGPLQNNCQRTWLKQQDQFNL